MIDLTKFDDVREITKDDLKGIKKLPDNDYLLKVSSDGVGFMAKLTKSGEIPSSFDSWREYHWQKTAPLKLYMITEKFRRDWKFIGLRHGQSTAWVVLQHPYGFEVEINSTAFEEISSSITMVNGRMVTPCYFQAQLKNAKLLVEKDDGQDFFYTLIKAVSDDKKLIEKLQEIIEDARPDRLYEVLTRSK